MNLVALKMMTLFVVLVLSASLGAFGLFLFSFFQALRFSAGGACKFLEHLNRQKKVDGESFRGMASTARTVFGDGDSTIVNVNFKVEGKVQGVFFRKYTQQKARELGLVGFVQNSPDGSVTGAVQGSKDAVAEMKQWLQSKGSPHSKISKAHFENEAPVSALQFKNFDVRSTS